MDLFENYKSSLSECVMEKWPNQQRITYKLAVLTLKTRRTSTPVYLSRLITARRSVAALCAPLQFHCYPCRSTRLRSQDELSAALRLPRGTLCRTLRQLLTH